MSITDILGTWRDAIAGGGAVAAVLGIGALLLLLAVGGAAVYISYLFSPQGKLDLLVQDKLAKRRNHWPLRIALLLLAVALPLGVQAGVNTKSACVSCHRAPAKQLAKSTHASTPCAGCHGARGLTAPVQNTISFARWGWATNVLQKKADETSASVEVDPRNCLSCHGDTPKATKTRNGIRVRHADFLGPSVSCLDCHGDIGHDTSTEAIGPKMSQCLPCHDGKTASAECSTCHVRDVAIDAAKRKGEPAPVNRLGISCYGECHDERNCLRCHGTTMPHPEGWSPYQDPEKGGLPGSHARAAFADRETCYRCHYKPGKPFTPGDEGCRCHTSVPGTMHGGSPWLKEHGLQATGQKQGELADCQMCHPANFCSYCHPSSYDGRLAPRVGADSYPRALQRTPLEQKMVDGL